VTTAARRPSTGRPSLSRELIATAALRLTRDEPNTPLTLARLGAELAADPTAIYRHFRNREELLLDLFEHAYEEVLARFSPRADWRSSLTEVAQAIRSVLLERPALVAEVGYRFTGGPREREAIRVTNELFLGAGLPHDEALQQVRVFGEMILAHVMMSAASMSLPPEAQRSELDVAGLAYGVQVGSMAAYEQDTFTRMVDTYLDGLTARLHAATRGRTRRTAS
jgi:AcrR family transcriptional regulator